MWRDTNCPDKQPLSDCLSVFVWRKCIVTQYLCKGDTQGVGGCLNLSCLWCSRCGFTPPQHRAETVGSWRSTLAPHTLVLLVLSQTARHKMAATWQLKNCRQSFYFLSFLKKRRKKAEKSFVWNRLVMLCWWHCRHESHFEVWLTVRVWVLTVRVWVLIVRVWVTRWYPWITTCFCFF